jgi:hypothetical protein
MLDHMEAVEYVLGKFFQHDENGFSNTRCDEEIAHYHDKQAKASSAGRASAERRLKQKSTSVEKQATDVQPTNNQEPITNNQEPVKKIQPRRSASIAKPEDIDQAVWDDFLAVRKAKRSPLTETALQAIQREADKAGWHLQQALQECVARGWQGFKAEWVSARQTKTLNKQEAIEARNRDVVERYNAELRAKGEI